jgi:hypothetical protein
MDETNRTVKLFCFDNLTDDFTNVQFKVSLKMLHFQSPLKYRQIKLSLQFSSLTFYFYCSQRISFQDLILTLNRYIFFSSLFISHLRNKISRQCSWGYIFLLQNIATRYTNPVWFSWDRFIYIIIGFYTLDIYLW